MKLIKLSARNIKGQSFDLELKSFNVLVGDNAVGKSARTDALRLLLLGYLPELGKTNQATWGLSSGREMTVEGIFDDGSKIFRRWYLSGDSIKSEASIPDQFQTNESLLLMLEPSAFFGLSERLRVDLVSKAFPGKTEVTPESLLEAIMARIRSEQEGAEEPEERLLPESIEKFRKDYEEEKVAEPRNEGEEILDHAIRTAESVAKSERNWTSVYSKTCQGLIKFRLDGTTGFIEPTDSLERRRGDIVKEIETLEKEKANRSSSAEAQTANEKRRSEISREIVALAPMKLRHKGYLEEIARIDGEVAILPKFEPKEIVELTDREKKADVEASVLKVRLSDAEQLLQKLESENTQLDTLQTCPYCGAQGNGWKKIKTEQLIEDMSLACEGITKIKKERAENAEESNLVGTKLRSIRGVDVLRGKRLAEMAKLEKDFLASVGFLKTIGEFEAKIAVLESKAEELPKIPASDPQLTAAIETTQSHLNVIRGRLSEIDDKLKAEAVRQGELKRLAESEGKRDIALGVVKACKTALEVLRQKQADDVRTTFIPLLASANSLFGSVLGFDLSWEQGEIGYWSSGRWVGFKTFSGTERLLGLSAIQMALASASPLKLLILDELGRLDALNLAKMSSAVNLALIDGRLDGFVGIAASGPELLEEILFGIEDHSIVSITLDAPAK